MTSFSKSSGILSNLINSYINQLSSLSLSNINLQFPFSVLRVPLLAMVQARLCQWLHSTPKILESSMLFLAFYFFVQTSCEFSFEPCNQVFDVNTNVDLGLKFSCSTSQPTKILDISHISSSLESVEQNIIKMNIVCCPTSPWTYNEQMEHLSCFLCFYRSSRP